MAADAMETIPQPSEDWEQYITRLREKYRTFRALKEEMAAGLLD